MSGWTELFTDGDASAFSVGPQTALMMLLLAFCIGHIVAWIYMWTHTGLSYSQMFTGSLLALPVIVCLVMLLVAGSITIALGLFAVIAIVRFRNVLKDTRDTVFILWAIVEGIAVGTTHYTTSIVGCLCIGAMFLYMRFTSFGGRQRYDVIVSLIWTGGISRLHELKNVLYRHSLRAQLASQRDLDEDNLDLSYRLELRDPTRSRELIAELQSTPGTSRVSLYHREDESEI
jgi:hypothetical protein